MLPARLNWICGFSLLDFPASIRLRMGLSLVIPTSLSDLLGNATSLGAKFAPMPELCSGSVFELFRSVLTERSGEGVAQSALLFFWRRSALTILRGV